MGPKKQAKESVNKREMITLEIKKEIIQKHERGVSVSDLSRMYNKASSTISTILKQKDKIMAVEASKGVSRITKNRPPIIEDVEKLLLVWINEKQLRGDSVGESIICEKARVLHADLLKKQPGTGSEEDVTFKASRGWFEKFKRRTGIHSVLRHGEASSSDTAAAEEYLPKFKRLVDSGGYIPQQVFNCDETGLFWKKMPRRTYITAEEKTMPGHKPMKDRLTLLFCANASGDLKIKPLLVYHSENPRAFKKCNVQKSQLPVMWMSNKKAWVTRNIFIDWVNNEFGPTVKKYLQENSLPLKALLVMDNAPGHLPGLEDNLLQEYNFIKIEFLPPNTTPLIQSMDQQVISNFKKLYTRALFQRCFDVTDATNLTLKEFWKDHFHIVACLKLIDEAWNGVSKRCLIAAWRNLWPDCAPDRDFKGFESVPEPPVVEDIVSLGINLGLEVDGTDVEELIAEHSQELTTEELLDLHSEQQREVNEELSSGEEEDRDPCEHQPSSGIKEMIQAWETVSTYVEKYLPNKAVAVRSTNLFNQNVIKHFRDILKRRQKQVSMDRYVVKRSAASVSETQPSDDLPTLVSEGPTTSRESKQKQVVEKPVVKETVVKYQSENEKEKEKGKAHGERERERERKKRKKRKKCK